MSSGNQPGRSAGSRHAGEVAPAKPASGAAGDVKQVAGAALLTFGSGLAVLDGYLLLDVIGGLLGIVAAAFIAAWWYGQHKELFPRNASAKALVVLGVISGLLLVLSFAFN
ncbi:hypothetical protein [Solihabitans fulvus]|uniref:hypothetical protein n=1 Tax=Solihabitans fulvus TaxID=1892852 RepID=UPI0016619AE2|nr:hypothetical protein [Solihabitans fulvus]